jgi:hypothetical protein
MKFYLSVIYLGAGVTLHSPSELILIVSFSVLGFFVFGRFNYLAFEPAVIKSLGHRLFSSFGFE